MHKKVCLISASCLVLLLLNASGSHALTPPTPANLMCYTCTNCAKVDEQTPQVSCDEQYFLSTTETPSSTQQTTVETETTEANTTTETTTDTTTSSSTAAPITTPEETTTEAVTETTIETTTETTSTSTTTGKPTPPTVAPVETTTAIPTPPNPGTNIAPSDLMLNLTGNANIENIINSTSDNSNSTTLLKMLPSRRRRDMPFYTYHCYSIQVKNASGTVMTDRGCARVPPQLGVCEELKEETDNDNVTINKCVACTMPLCNSSSALSVSLISMFGALLFVAIAKLC